MFRLLLKITIVCAFFILGMYAHHQMDGGDFTYKDCTSMDTFADKAVNLGAVMVTNGMTRDGVVSLWLLPDGSVGMYIYLEAPDMVCMIGYGFLNNPAVVPGGIAA